MGRLHAAFSCVSLCYSIGNASHSSRGHVAEVVSAGGHIVLGISSGVGVCHVLLRIPVIACSAGKVAAVALAMLRRGRSLAIVVVLVAFMLVVAVVLALMLVRGHRRRLMLVVIDLGRRVAATIGGNSSMRLAVAIERFALGRVAVFTVALHGGFDLRLHRVSGFVILGSRLLAAKRQLHVEPLLRRNRSRPIGLDLPRGEELLFIGKPELTGGPTLCRSNVDESMETQQLVDRDSHSQREAAQDLKGACG